MANPKIKWHYSPVMLQVTDEAGQPYTFSPDSEVLSRANHTGTQDVSTITGLGSAATKDVGVADGVAPLDATGKLSSAYLPALSITDVNVIASEAEQLALTVQEGDVAVRTDLNKSFVHNGGTAGTMADWQELLTPTDAVLSVFGRTGSVTAQSGDYTAAQITVADTGGNFTATDVESALAEIPGLIDAAKVQFFTESRSTAAPNATVPVHAWSATGAEADIDIALVPKGDGAITANAADGTATGGNKRGRNAVDLQQSRPFASYVASGVGACIPGGGSNTASGMYSFAFGVAATSAGTFSTAIGSNCLASGELSVSLGFQTTASGTSSIATGVFSDTRSLHAKRTHAGDKFSLAGSSQYGDQPLQAETTDATAMILTADNGVPTSTNVPIVPNGFAYGVIAHVVAREPSTYDMKMWRIEGAVKRGAGESTTALVGAPTVTIVAEDASATAWDCNLVVNTSRGSVEVEVTGEAGKTLHWMCKFNTVEVQ